MGQDSVEKGTYAGTPAKATAKINELQIQKGLISLKPPWNQAFDSESSQCASEQRWFEMSAFVPNASDNCGLDNLLFRLSGCG